jgi:hypothetical protein
MASICLMESIKQGMLLITSGPGPHVYLGLQALSCRFTPACDIAPGDRDGSRQERVRESVSVRVEAWTSGNGSGQPTSDLQDSSH